MIAPEAGSDFGADGQSLAAPWDGSRRLWSLWEMLEVFAHQYIQLGARIGDIRLKFALAESNPPDSPRREPFQHEINDLRTGLMEILKMSTALDLPVSKVLIETRLRDDLPQTAREVDIIMDAVISELKTKKFFHVPAHRARYYDLIIPSIVTTRFETASRELIWAGNAYAAALYTGCVFYAMRAAEIGVRTLATSLGVTFNFPIEFAEWGKIVGEIESKIASIEKQPRGQEREDDLAFYSEAASQFRYFNAGWRVRNSHARATFDEGQAITVLDHTLDFFRTLATRLNE